MMSFGFASVAPEKRCGSLRTSVGNSGWLPSFADISFLFPILALLWCTNGVGWLLTDSDTGWHIRTGDWILQQGSVPQSDPFSFTKIGQPWIAWEWLSDVVMGVAHRLGGLGAVVFIAMLLLGGTSLSIYRNTLRESGHILIAIVLTWMATAASTVHWLARPHLVTPLMAAMFSGVLSEVERSGNAKKLWSPPPLTVVWANLHGGFVVGLFLIATHALGGALGALFHHSVNVAKIRFWQYAVVTLACALASLINPYGIRLDVHLARYLGSSFYWERISEFRSIDFHSSIAAHFETLLILAIASAAYHLKRKNITHTLVLLSWSHLALFSVRNVPVFAAIVVPSIGFAMKEWSEGARAYWRESRLRGLCDAICSLQADLSLMAGSRERAHIPAAPCIAFLVFAFLLFHPGRSKAFVPKFDGSQFPVGAAAFLLHEPQVSYVRIYSNWQWGGYLIYSLWPRFRVFNDGRTDFYGPEFIDEGVGVWEVRPDWTETLARYSVDAVLVPLQSALAAVLWERKDWRPIYQDRVSVLFGKVGIETFVELSSPGRATDRGGARESLVLDSAEFACPSRRLKHAVHRRRPRAAQVASNRVAKRRAAVCPARPKKCGFLAPIVRTRPAYIARNCRNSRQNFGTNRSVQS